MCEPWEQPRSQGSLLPALRSERERDPGKRWSRGSRTKLILREQSFVSHFFVWFIRNVHVGRVGENAGNEVALGTAKITP